MPPQISVLGTGPVWNESENHCSATEPRGVRLYREHRPAVVQGKTLYSRGRAFSFSGAWRSRDHVLARSDSLAVNWNADQWALTRGDSCENSLRSLQSVNPGVALVSSCRADIVDVNRSASIVVTSSHQWLNSPGRMIVP